jgi:site-specific DNA recombinase
MAELIQSENAPANTEQMIVAAQKQSERLRSDLTFSTQSFVRKVVQRVVVHSDKIEVEVNKSELRAALVGGTPAVPRQNASDIIRLALEARVKRCGGETRLVVPPELTGQVSAHPVPSL